MPPLHAAVPSTPRLPSALRALGFVLPLLLLSGCSKMPAGDEAANKPAASNAASAPAQPDPGFMRIGSVTPASGDAPPVASATAAAAAGKDRGGEVVPPPAAPQANERGESPPLPHGAPPVTGGTKVGAASAETASGLSEAEIHAAIGQKQADFKVCYDLGRSGSGYFAGSVTVRASINASGDVAAIEVTGSTTKNTSVDACVRDALIKIRFPGKPGGTVVQFPIDFGR